MTLVMVHDYSQCTKEQTKVGDFSNAGKYPIDSIDAIKLINEIIYNEKGHNYAFYTMDDEYLLDLS